VGNNNQRGGYLSQLSVMARGYRQIKFCTFGLLPGNGDDPCVADSLGQAVLEWICADVGEDELDFRVVVERGDHVK
jgi:hypothetical protein